jgi:hypothetical protein
MEAIILFRISPTDDAVKFDFWKYVVSTKSLHRQDISCYRKEISVATGLCQDFLSSANLSFTNFYLYAIICGDIQVFFNNSHFDVKRV